MTGCCVENCHNRDEKGYVMLRFPKDPVLKAKWVQAINNKVGWIPKAGSRICQAHFVPSQWIKYGWRLKPGEVPSVFLKCKESNCPIMVQNCLSGHLCRENSQNSQVSIHQSNTYRRSSRHVKLNKILCDRNNKHEEMDHTYNKIATSTSCDTPEYCHSVKMGGTQPSALSVCNVSRDTSTFSICNDHVSQEDDGIFYDIANKIRDVICRKSFTCTDSEFSKDVISEIKVLLGSSSWENISDTDICKIISLIVENEHLKHQLDDMSKELADLKQILQENQLISKSSHR